MQPTSRCTEPVRSELRLDGPDVKKSAEPVTTTSAMEVKSRPNRSIGDIYVGDVTHEQREIQRFIEGWKPSLGEKDKG